MIAKDLNIIQSYISSPTPEKAKIIIENYFDSTVREEFFWMKAAIQNQKLIFDQILQLKPQYFSDRFNEIFNGKSTGVSFYSIRFLVDLSKAIKRENGDFLKLIEITNVFIDLSSSKETNNLQAIWFIAEAITEFPLDLISDKHLTYISNKSLESNVSLVAHSIEEKLIPRIIKEKNSDLLFKVIKDILFAYEIKGENSNKSKYLSHFLPKFDSYILSKILSDENIRSISTFCSFDEICSLLSDIINQVSKEKPFEFSSLNIPSIEETDQIWDKDGFPYQIIRFLRELTSIYKPTKSAVEKQFLHSETSILKRVALHQIGEDYNNLKGLIWQWDQGNPLDLSDLKHEIFTLLQRNADKITASEINILFKWIDNIKIPSWDEKVTKEELEKHRALIGKEYLAALGKISHELESMVKDKKAELDLIHPHDREHPGFNSYHSVSSGFDYPDTEAEFEKHTSDAKTLVEYLKGNEINWTPNEIKGQISRLENWVQKKPELIDSTDKLIRLDFQYLGNVIYGLEKAWENGKELNWDAIFILTDKIIDSQDWTTPTREGVSFLGYFAWLVRAATKDDNKAIAGNQLVEAKNIILKLLRLNIISERLNNDPFFDILNSTEGKILDAMLNVLLRNARLNNKDKKDKWFPDVKEYYSELFEKRKYNDAHLYNVAGHLPQFGFLDIEWVEKHVDYIFPKESVEEWKLSMNCYTRFTSTLYKDLFLILNSHSHYEYGINVFTEKGDGTAEFIRHVALSCFAKWEGQSISNPHSLINLLFNKANINQIDGLISFLYTTRKIKSDQELLYSIWQKVTSCEYVTDVDKIIAFRDSLRLISKFDKVDEKLYALILSILNTLPNKDKENLFDLVRYLVTSKGDDLEFRAKLLMFGTSDNLDKHFFREEFENIAKQLFKINPSLANDFIESMLSKRLFSLLSVYNENVIESNG